jgi:hypothetical protein
MFYKVMKLRKKELKKFRSTKVTVYLYKSISYGSDICINNDFFFLLEGWIECQMVIFGHIASISIVGKILRKDSFCSKIISSKL